MNLRVILAIAGKDIVDAVRNLYVLFGIIFPLGIWLLFRILLPGAGDIQVGPIAIYDQGDSRLTDLLRAEPVVKSVIVVRSMDDLVQAVRKDAVGGLALPADFEAALAEEGSPEVTMLLNGRRTSVELGTFRRVVDDRIRELADRPPPVRLVERDVSEASPTTAAQPFSLQGYLLVLLLVMGLTMTGTFVVPTLLVEEKEKRTLKAILVSPASYGDVVAGKAVVGLLYAFLMAAALLVLNDGLSGNLALLVVGVVLGSLFLVEVGLLMGALFNTSGQVNTWSGVVMLLLLAPTWTTGIWVSEAVDRGLHLLPTFYLSNLIHLARGETASGDVLSSVGVLVGCIAVLFIVILWALRRSES